ncbi:PKD domain-containing protein [Maribellus comscasis]|uniref:PKD domain-containing protein n=1 Tax=Maribellus comscasis TaxID=2681766 RepID=A0A6I6JYU8_9BACT|nr:PKD domain-containing protein [Maribellus comscasis]QGY46509.1 PKD domain-containing protein [Maribellus comscasis]
MKSIVQFILVTLMLPTMSCKEEDCNPDCDNIGTPIAAFEYSRFRCENSSNNCVQFQNISENTTEKSTYLWIFGDGETSDNKNPAHRFKDYGEFNVVLHVTNCSGKASYYSETINIGFD